MTSRKSTDKVLQDLASYAGNISSAIFAEQIIAGRWQANCYVVHKITGDALIVDPGDEPGRIIDYVERKRLRICAILGTHGHHDHIGAVTTLKNAFAVPFYLHSGDVRLLKYANLYRQMCDGSDPIVPPSVDYHIDKVEIPIRVGEFSIDVLFTPGHTRGGVCFLIGDFLFTGDTLLNGRVGRVDLPGADRTALCDSLRKLSVLPPETKVCPGHGRTTTLLEEWRANRELREAIEKT